MVFLEQLTVFAFFRLMPYFLAHLFKKRSKFYFQYFASTLTGRWLLSMFTALGCMNGKEVDYTYEEVLDTKGGLLIQRALESDSLSVCESVCKDIFDYNPTVARFSQRFDRSKIILYAQKELHEEIKVILCHITIVSWLIRNPSSLSTNQAVFLIPKTNWVNYIEGYADLRGLHLGIYGCLPRVVLFSFPLRRLMKLMFPFIRNLLKNVFLNLFNNTLVEPESCSKSTLNDNQVKQRNCTVAATYWGRGSTLDQSKSSDFFWVPFANLAPGQLLIYASRPDAPINHDEYAHFKNLSIRVAVVNEAARLSSTIPKWPAQKDFNQLIKESLSMWKFLGQCFLKLLISKGVTRWLERNLIKFVFAYVYWRWFFNSNDIKLVVDHVDWPKGRVASDQALADLGGLSVSYQRSFEALPTLVRASGVDVHFAFSIAWATTERSSKSVIPQYISNGYVHDYAIPHVANRASRLRTKLEASGAKFIICLLDENSVPDKRFGPSHAMRAENYKFLLEKLLLDPTLGLVIKPKKPSDLRMRLGHVSKLLDRALETGRCHIYDQGVVATDILPSEASLSSDVCIGLLFGSTAALESALTGTPTLLIDREFVTYHPLNELGVDRVVFRSWSQLWEAISRFRLDPARLQGIGDWTPMLDTLDSFRDGKAGQRMGEYIGWLAQGLADGYTREEVLEVASRRYCERWGEDKIVSLK